MFSPASLSGPPALFDVLFGVIPTLKWSEGMSRGAHDCSTSRAGALTTSCRGRGPSMVFSVSCRRAGSVPLKTALQPIASDTITWT